MYVIGGNELRWPPPVFSVNELRWPPPAFGGDELTLTVLHLQIPVSTSLR